jgi:hypothetical protein
MAGLLDSLAANPEGFMALSAGLLGGNFAGGMAGYGQATAQKQKDALQSQLVNAQLQNYASEIEARKAAIAKDARKQDLIGGIFGAGGLAAPQVDPGAFRPGGDGMGPTMPPSMAAMAAPGSRLANLGFDQLAALKANGMDLVDLHKYANDPLKLEQGATYKSRLDGSERFMPKVEAGIAPDPHGFYNALPGYAAAQGSIEGAKTAAQESAKAGSDLVKVVNSETGAEEYVSRSKVLQAAGAPQPRAPVAPTQPRPATGGRQPLTMPGDADRPAIFAQEMQGARARLASARTPEEQQRAQNDIAGLTREMTAAGIAPQGPMQATPTNAQAATAAANKETAILTAKDIAETRKNIMNGGFAASSNIAKYQQLGKLLEGVDGGTLTATGTQIASTMNSLGFKIDKNLPNKEAAAALGNQMALELRNPANGAGMPGAMSDADRNYLVSMIPNAGQSLQGRKQLIDAQIQISERSKQVAAFARNYEKKYGRLDNGFFEQMQAWSDSNPLFKAK